MLEKVWARAGSVHFLCFHSLPPVPRRIGGAVPLSMVKQNLACQGSAGILIIQTELSKILPVWSPRSLPAGLIYSLMEADN